MLSTFIIALREGLEASLIVGILLAYLKKTDRRHLLRPLWFGVGAAIVLTLGLGAGLSFTSTELSDRGEKLFAGITSVIAVSLVTVMVFWMKSAARGMRENLHNRVDSSATTTGVGAFALALTAFFAVAREGLETALFLYANFTTAGESVGPSIGLVLGLFAAILLGYLLYKRALSFNIGQFFKLTGVALIVVAAGVLSHGVREFQELAWLPGGSRQAWNIDSWLSPDSFVASLLSGSIGFSTTTSWLQVGIWVLYLVLVWMGRCCEPIPSGSLSFFWQGDGGMR